MFGHPAANVLEQTQLQFDGPLLGREDVALILFQLVCDVAFGVLDGLSADVLRRHFAPRTVWHLDVVSENAVESDPE